MQTLLLTVEILSPSTARYDRFTKRRLYQEVGVGRCWIVDPAARSVEVWTPGDTFPVTEETRLVWQPEGAPDPLVIELAAVFRPV